MGDEGRGHGSPLDLPSEDGTTGIGKPLKHILNGYVARVRDERTKISLGGRRFDYPQARGVKVTLAHERGTPLRRTCRAKHEAPLPLSRFGTYDCLLANLRGCLADQLLDRLQAAVGDRYSVERRLGRGGMATVFLARDQKNARAVAVKVLHPELATGLGIERFKREIAIAGALVHPHIVALLDSGQAEGLLFYFMPYIQGETLRQRLQREGQLAIDDALRIVGDIAEAIAYAHSQGVIHRDIKPENILFAAGHWVVTDFGIARAITALRQDLFTDTGIILGTPEYMSPEQVGAHVDGRSDIYSLGCVLYELLAGEPPFTGPTAQAVFARHAVDAPPSLRSVRPTVSEPLEGVVFQALAKVPADRFATAADFRDALTAPTARSALPDGRSLAVLPFANQSGDPAVEYFSDGVSEEIIIALTRLPGLRVAARTSSFAFRGTDLDLPAIGAKLKVAAVLEGSVRKAGDRLRITARLAKVTDGFTLWSERYDREMTDVFAIQDDIATAIAAGLQVTFEDWEGNPHPKPLVTPATANLEAYDLYLKGRYHLTQRGAGLKRALAAFEEAVSLDPDCAPAHAGVAEACVVLAQYGLIPPRAIRAKAHAAARRALALAPESSEAHCASGALSLVCDWDWATASVALQRAVELNPRYVVARIWLAFYLVFVAGRPEAGIEQAQRATELDPLAPLPATQLGMTLLGAGRYEEAEAALRRARELDPMMFLAPTHLGLLYSHLGRTDEAIAVLDGAIAVSGRHPWTLSALAVCYGALGKLGDVEAIRDELVARARREYVQSTMLAVLAGSLGRMDEAFQLLERAFEEHDGILVYSKRYPFLKVLQTDSRMQGIFRGVGFPNVP